MSVSKRVKRAMCAGWDTSHLFASPPPPPEVRVIRREVLEMAAAAIRQSAELLRESLEDLGGRADEVDHVLAAIAHVVEDDFRSHECRGGS